MSCAVKLKLTNAKLMPALSLFSSFTYTRNALPTVSDNDDQLLKSSPESSGASAKGFSFAIVASRWNASVVSRLIEGALDALAELSADQKAIEIFRVPGSFEIPLCALKAAESGKFDAIICLGVIIRGETPHFEYIATAVARGIGEASLKTGVPLLFGIITAENVDQAIDRAGVKLGNKGFEAATAAVELVNLYREAFKK
jgi:6,7-dimethyl-8-ribityllumazine synthase